jgi:hypothetical protein
MKYPACFILFFICLYCNAQFICNTVSENGTLTLTAPAGNYFTTIQFASYGTPNGSCGSFTTSACHAASSASICSTAFVGKTSASIAATNGVFGDPCVGTVKRLYVQAAYASIVPLKLVSFTARSLNGRIILEWISEEEVNTSHFIVESSVEGEGFLEAGRVPAKGGIHNNYHFELAASGTNKMFRLKMLDKDEKYTFSNIVRVTGTSSSTAINVYPNPVTNYLTVSLIGDGLITNMQGQLIRRFSITHERTNVSISNLKPGMYVILIGVERKKFIKY